MAPRYQEIKQHIVHNIQMGRWLPDTQVPSENQLAAQFSVSRMTARRALTELTDTGILERTQGQGTFVARELPTGAALEIHNIADEIASRDNQHRAQVVSLAPCQLDALQAKALKMSIGESAFFSRIVHYENNIPIQLEERTVNPGRVPHYLTQDFSQQSPNAYLCAQVPLSEADHWIEAVLPTAEQAQWLAIDPNQPCLKISRRTFDPHKQVVNFAVLYHPGNRYQLGSHHNFEQRSL